MQQPITPETYHADLRHISKSGIDLILRSPLHYFQKYYGAGAARDTAAFAAGRALHVALSEPHRFNDLYIVAPGSIDRRNRGGKQRFEDFERAARGKTVIPEIPVKRAEGGKSRVLSYEQVMRMRDAVFAHPLASMLMLAGEAEKVLTWEDDITGAPCKGMMDWLPKGGNFVLDFKSAEDASPQGFAKSVRYFHYARQDAHYINGLSAVTGLHYQMIFVVVEKHAPYAVELYALRPERRQEAQNEISQALETYMGCKTAYNKTGDAGVWYGYNEFKTVKVI